MVAVVTDDSCSCPKRPHWPHWPPRVRRSSCRSRGSGYDGVDAFAADVRNAVLTEPAALDVLVEAGAPPGALSFLGHSAGGALGAILSAVEPRLARIAIFGKGASSVG